MCPYRVSELLPRRNGFTANLASGIDVVLALHGGNDLRHRNLQFCELVRLHPQPHGILTRSEDYGLADTIRACDGIVEVDISVVREVIRVASAVRRVQSDQHERSSRRLLERDSVVVHLRRQLTVCQLLTRLREQQIGVGIRLEIEIDKQLRLLVGGRV